MIKAQSRILYFLNLNQETSKYNKDVAADIATDGLVDRIHDYMDEKAIRVLKKDVLSNSYPTVDSTETSMLPGLTNNSNSFAAKYLKKCGWKGEGHGIGKESNGISEPISLQIYNNRQGLGSGKELVDSNEIDENLELCSLARKRDILKNLKDFFTSYLKSPTKIDIIFEKKFTKNDRKLIHGIANTMGLKTKSHGDDKNRFLTISKNCSTFEILDQLKKDNNSAFGGKFKLLSE